MPTYVYRCKKGHTFELFHAISDESPRRCPQCRSVAKRVPAGGSGLLFKGSGFYITDYRSSGYKESAKQESGGKSDKAPTPASGSSTGGSGRAPASPPAGEAGGKAPGQSEGAAHGPSHGSPQRTDRGSSDRSSDGSSRRARDGSSDRSSDVSSRRTSDGSSRRSRRKPDK